MARGSRRNEVFEPSRSRSRFWLRLGDSAGYAKRVERVLEVPPGSVAEAGACCRRIDPPQLPTQSIESYGVIWAVHLALSMQRPRPRGGYGVRTAGRYLWRITFACFGSSTFSGGSSLTSFAARVGGKVAQSSVS